jgi:hypothetical protein
MGKQKLSPGARARKAERDLCYAKGWVWNPETGTCSKSGSGRSTSQHKRKEKKAENQRIGQNSTSDIHHVNGKVGNTKRVSISSNRDTFKNGDRKKKKKTTKK